jgi:hypothetical protein
MAGAFYWVLTQFPNSVRIATWTSKHPRPKSVPSVASARRWKSFISKSPESTGGDQNVQHARLNTQSVGTSNILTELDAMQKRLITIGRTHVSPKVETTEAAIWIKLQVPQETHH